MLAGSFCKPVRTGFKADYSFQREYRSQRFFQRKFQKAAENDNAAKMGKMFEPRETLDKFPDVYSENLAHESILDLLVDVLFNLPLFITLFRRKESKMDEEKNLHDLKKIDLLYEINKDVIEKMSQTLNEVQLQSGIDKQTKEQQLKIHNFYKNSPCYKQLIDNTEARPYPKWRNQSMFQDKLTRNRRSSVGKTSQGQFEFLTYTQIDTGMEDVENLSYREKHKRKASDLLSQFQKRELTKKENAQLEILASMFDLRKQSKQSTSGEKSFPKLKSPRMLKKPKRRKRSSLCLKTTATINRPKQPQKPMSQQERRLNIFNSLMYLKLPKLKPTFPKVSDKFSLSLRAYFEDCSPDVVQAARQRLFGKDNQIEKQELINDFSIIK